MLEVVEEVLTRYHSQKTTQLDGIEAFRSATINENIHLDCVYFLLRRHPDVLVPPLLGSHNNNNNNDDVDEDNENLNDDEGGKEKQEKENKDDDDLSRKIDSIDTDTDDTEAYDKRHELIRKRKRKRKRERETAAAAASTESEEEDIVVLPFVSFPSDNT